ncbi:zinc-binding metallopeptidase family protein [Aestuariirhabdus litorea]|uniref:Zinc-ribbon domain-containing protein n=1 Tax=Aestuariirhabdus litorea TaxID=2528527 RepID=A0A3P3VML0_9GAMM|nr:putative zinc-binding metallopeptidase [Aestuariirhabdus litorea]RRJ84001.1 hypothetical protein D0544_02455 [Aestuariirhabdus litorea]RWW97221.1 hypothetical protein DZC74_02450 [Endozoicomonadaceae bacterium GTF-13]
MRFFNCDCGQTLYFDNTGCLACGQAAGFDPEQLQLLSLTEEGNGSWRAADGRAFRYCQNHAHFGVCNWLVAADSPALYCRSCELNQIVPQVTEPDRCSSWHILEQAKRRLIYSLLQLGLPVQPRSRYANGLAFAFLEDQRINPQVQEEIVSTGHGHGLITINLAEADDVMRETMRVSMGEKYRTLLGHFRHESGHYFFDRLVSGTPWHQAFRELFGDDTLNYADALAHYYSGSVPSDLSGQFITDYAQSHPLEDWAECWAHYLHMMDGLETAHALELLEQPPLEVPFEENLRRWPELTRILNQLNRSLGLKDAYPFVLSDPVMRKLHLIHRVIDPSSPTT